ncbi:MAG: DinB family protein [Chloroflexota bacterium]
MTDTPAPPTLASTLAIRDVDSALAEPILPTLAAALAILEATPTTLKALVTGVPTEVVINAPDGEWDVRSVMAHIFLTDPVAFDRLRKITDEDHPTLAAVDEQAMLAASPARTYSIPTLLYRVNFGRLKLIAYLRTLTPTQLERTGEHPTVGTISSYELLHHLAYEDLKHIRQIATLLADTLDGPRGPFGEL